MPQQRAYAVALAFLVPCFTPRPRLQMFLALWAGLAYGMVVQWAFLSKMFFFYLSCAGVLSAVPSIQIAFLQDEEEANMKRLRFEQGAMEGRAIFFSLGACIAQAVWLLPVPPHYISLPLGVGFSLFFLLFDDDDFVLFSIALMGVNAMFALMALPYYAIINHIAYWPFLPLTCVAAHYWARLSHHLLIRSHPMAPCSGL
eukprot:gnl/Hemi2/15120_TR5104_c0_g1_i1.p2 gnl/Hemi2/15120_TR5104_c0_g1~~gnl/Hemi2/15120_TR5104_c0_g1_i1.p2  ORF type:complete len:200 (+),score=55.60 gnl/Hemi2/15120_TR5104_c0_g1_i1:221-820(+)